jgi:hypothetical protein
MGGSIATGQSLAPDQVPVSDKEMRVAACRLPNRRSEGRPTKQIDFDGPSSLPCERQLDMITAFGT